MNRSAIALCALLLTAGCFANSSHRIKVISRSEAETVFMDRFDAHADDYVERKSGLLIKLALIAGGVVGGGGVYKAYHGVKNGRAKA